MMPWFTALPFVHFLDFKNREVNHAARFEKESRYYVLRLEKDLLDDWTITAINGRIKSKLGQSRIIAFPSFVDAFASFCDMAKLRYQRGYHLKTIVSDNPLVLHLLPYLLSVVEAPKNTTNSRAQTKLVSFITNRTQPVNSPQITPKQMGFLF